MLGLLIIYFIGKKFFDLAREFDKNKWGFAIAGVGSYYVGTFIGGVIITICLDIFLDKSIEEMDEFGLALIALPFGLLASWGLFVLLKRNWKGQPIYHHSDILDEDLAEY